MNRLFSAIICESFPHTAFKLILLTVTQLGRRIKCGLACRGRATHCNFAYRSKQGQRVWNSYRCWFVYMREKYFWLVQMNNVFLWGGWPAPAEQGHKAATMHHSVHWFSWTKTRASMKTPKPMVSPPLTSDGESLLAQGLAKSRSGSTVGNELQLIKHKRTNGLQSKSPRT